MRNPRDMNRFRLRAIVLVLVFWVAGDVSFAGEPAEERAADTITENSSADDRPKPESPSGSRPSTSRPGVRMHRKIVHFELGEGPRSYIIFEPADPSPERAPVVVFLHGWFAVNPAIYGAWIDHLVGNGKIVIFPRYQNDVSTSPQQFLANALAAIRDALLVLESGRGHVRPRLDQLALIGHSAGGNLAAYIAAVASDPHSGIPSPNAVLALMPGEVFPQKEPSLSRIPAKTLLVVMVGEEDLLVGDLRGREIFAGAVNVPRSRKRFVLFRSDRHGFPPLVAEHTAPTGANRRLDNGDGVFKGLQLTLGEVNAFDHAGFWRITDLTLHAADTGKTLDNIIRDPEQYRHLGFWSDGRRVTPPIIADNLDDVPRVFLTNGVRIIPWKLPERITSTKSSDRSRLK